MNIHINTRIHIYFYLYNSEKKNPFLRSNATHRNIILLLLLWLIFDFSSFVLVSYSIFLAVSVCYVVSLSLSIVRLLFFLLIDSLFFSSWIFSLSLFSNLTTKQDFSTAPQFPCVQQQNCSPSTYRFILLHYSSFERKKTQKKLVPFYSMFRHIFFFSSISNLFRWSFDSFVFYYSFIWHFQRWIIKKLHQCLLHVVDN